MATYLLGEALRQLHTQGVALVEVHVAEENAAALRLFENLGFEQVDSAIDCVDCWRQSPGHWGAVRSDQPQFGYDIKKGENGIWYATGLFGNRQQ